MDSLQILLLDLSDPQDKHRDNYTAAIKYIQSLPEVKLARSTSSEDALNTLVGSEEEFDIFIMWLSRGHAEEWRRWIDYIIDGVAYIVVFSFEEDVDEFVRDIMLHGMYTFACPFNTDVLGAYVKALALEEKQDRALTEIAERMQTAESLDEIVEIVLEELQQNQLVGYDRITISLVDQRTGQRYLLRHDPPIRNPDRHLLTSVEEDRVMRNILKEGVFILGDLSSLRNNETERDAAGWVDSGATRNINSWLGIALESFGKVIGIITLDHYTPGRYAFFGERRRTFLQAFARITANSIETVLKARNQRVLSEIAVSIGDDLQAEDLVREILRKLQAELKCDNCTYFTVFTPLESVERHLREWVGANDPQVPNHWQRKQRLFKIGEGVAGHVLADGQSRIIPHALESLEFRPTSRLSGSDLSMIVVPVIPQIRSDRSSSVIGVISCYKAGKTDHFTPYDRDLVEVVAQHTATIIERTVTLEYAHQISKEINTLIPMSDKAITLRKICEHALRVTSAREAIIHRLKLVKQSDGKEEYRPTGETYVYPEGVKPIPPRLDGRGTTDLIITEMRTIQFSESDGNADRISAEFRARGIKHLIAVPLIITESDKQHLIGALYLNKYTEGRFSDIEEFSLSLFASNAASVISNQEFLLERLTWTKANTDLAEAIEKIARSSHGDLLLRDIALYAGTLVAASFSYLAIRVGESDYKFRAAWPEYILAELISEVMIFNSDKGNPKYGNKKGITGLAAFHGKTILIEDILAEKEQDTENWRHYIDFGKETRSELAVPIKEEPTGRVIGVINLEHKEPFAFTEVHQRVIELFARQVAIAFQKNALIDTIARKNQILKDLQDSVQQVIASPSQTMLQNAVQLTRNALGADAVIFVPIRQKGQNVTVEAERIVTTIAEYQFRTNKVIRSDGHSLQVYTNQEPLVIANIATQGDSAAGSTVKANPFMNELGMRAGLCLPLSSYQEHIGVMWILFHDPLPEPTLSEENLTIYRVYANQIALAYTNAQQAAQLRQSLARAENDFTNNIDAHYKDARRQSALYFILSLLTSIAGIFLAVWGTSNIFSGQTSSMVAGTFAAIFGVLFEAASVLVFLRANAANERMDRYHQELFRVRQLNILLSATDQLEQDTAFKSKVEIIQTTMTNWFGGTSRSDPTESN